MTADPLETALRIGAKLGATAIWSGGACGWLADAPGTRTRTTEALGAGLYGGQAGVVLFLAHLSSLTGDRRMAALAEGALKTLEWLCSDKRHSTDSSFYLGMCGQAFALSEAARLLESPHLFRLGEARADKARAYWRDQTMSAELLAGDAGVLAFAIKRWEGWGQEADLDWARAAAARIATAARHDDYGGSSWLTVRGERLAGMAHGASGIVSALVRLQQIDPDPARHHLIEKALSFEGRLFDPAQGNWLDMRGAGGEPSNGRHMLAWCHGAPGVGAARLAPLLQATGSARDDAVIALDTTERKLRTALTDGSLSDGVCHGMAGLADILKSASVYWADRAGEGQENACTRWAETAKVWAGDLDDRLGTTGSRSLNFSPLKAAPALFTGWAGVGYILLRMQDDKRPPDILGLPG